MDGWLEGIQQALDHIERHLDGELSIADIARHAYVSPFYFQRIFTALCGVSVSEYIRRRRLTLAAQELTATDARVIDLAVKYGYDSPDSFTRAFQRFHGVSPSGARKSGAKLRAYAPLHIRLTLEGGHMLSYQLVDKPAFTVVGVTRRFSPETSYQDIPAFWNEIMTQGAPWQRYGVCIDPDETDGAFDYMIANDYEPGQAVPEGCVIQAIPSATWAVFPVHGALPDALQEVNTRIWAEWLPSLQAYRLAGKYNIELYTPMTEKPEETYSEIWIPLKRVTEA